MHGLACVLDGEYQMPCCILTGVSRWILLWVVWVSDVLYSNLLGETTFLTFSPFCCSCLLDTNIFAWRVWTLGHNRFWKSVVVVILVVRFSYPWCSALRRQCPVGFICPRMCCCWYKRQIKFRMSDPSRVLLLITMASEPPIFRSGMSTVAWKHLLPVRIYTS